MSLSPVPLKTCRGGERSTLNMSKAQTSSRLCGVWRGGCQLRIIPPNHTLMISRAPNHDAKVSEAPRLVGWKQHLYVPSGKRFAYWHSIIDPHNKSACLAGTIVLYLAK
ncbi:hypothetical protein TNCV_778051 [Trichonephila clavipes]|nr:hypothetical protein TNCV_778051 [Trichonephila clavipes]